LSVLATGEPAIVWADMFQLRYHALPSGGFPGMRPIVIYGYNSDTGEIRIADRSSVPLTAMTGEVSAARAAQGNLENRILTIDKPEKGIKSLGKSIRGAIKDCTSLYTEKPPRGPAGNFGFKALDKWAELIVNERRQKGWKTLFADRVQLYEALKSVYTQIEDAGNGGGASRPTYAAFLEEAAVVMDKPALVEVAEQFQMAGEKWTELAVAALPEDVEALRETRDLILRRGQIFRAMGQAALLEMDQIAVRLNELRDEVGQSFPLSDDDGDGLLSDLQAGIHRIHQAEEAAVKALKKVVK
jgi:hypothetical protein